MQPCGPWQKVNSFSAFLPVHENIATYSGSRLSGGSKKGVKTIARRPHLDFVSITNSISTYMYLTVGSVYNVHRLKYRDLSRLDSRIEVGQWDSSVIVFGEEVT